MHDLHAGFDSKVVFHLLPIPNRGKGSTSLAHPKPEDGVEKPPAKRIRRSGKGKGKDKLAEPPNLPSELQGLSSWTRTGKRRCWSFNMACGCPTAKAGQSCERGCMFACVVAECTEPPAAPKRPLLDRRAPWILPMPVSSLRGHAKHPCQSNLRARNRLLNAALCRRLSRLPACHRQPAMLAATTPRVQSH